MRTIASFKTLEIRGNLNIELIDTTSFFVQVDGPINLLPDIETSVENGRLFIKDHNTCKFVRSYKRQITVRIGSPGFSDIQNYGTGNITSIGKIECPVFRLENRDASGLAKLSLHCDTVRIFSHTGTTDIRADGIATVGEFFNQGLGLLDGKNLVCESAFVNNSSINDIYVNATQYLFATLSYSGNIYVYGSPAGWNIDNQSNGRVLFNP